MVQFAVIAAASLATIAGASGAAAQSVPTLPAVHGPVTTTGSTPIATEDDAETKKWEILRPAADALAAVTVAYPDDFAYSNFTDTGFIVAFASTAPADALALLKATDVPFELIENTGFSSHQMETDVLEISDRVKDFAPPGVAFEVAADPEKAAFDVTLYGPEPISLSRSTDPLEGFVASSGLRIEIGSEDGGLVETGYGLNGGSLLLSNGNPKCTSAFVVKSTSSADLGLLTAGHCPSSMEYPKYEVGAIYTLTTSGGAAYGSAGDVRFLRSPVMMDAWFVADTNAGLPVLDARNPTGGESVCRYGVSSNQKLCGPIIGVITAYTNTDGVTIGGVASAKIWAQYGDSGGPVYGGNTAMGILSGTRYLPNLQDPDKSDNMKVWFTKIDNAEAITGTRVCLDPVCRW